MSNVSRNDITGDELKSKTPTEKYRDGWDRIFGQKKEQLPPVSEQKKENNKNKK